MKSMTKKEKRKGEDEEEGGQKGRRDKECAQRRRGQFQEKERARGKKREEYLCNLIRAINKIFQNLTMNFIGDSEKVHFEFIALFFLEIVIQVRNGTFWELFWREELLLEVRG